MPLGSSPSKADSNPSGLKLPLKGAKPAVIDVAASSSKMVLLKLSQLLPTSVNSSISVPDGLIRNTSKSEFQV